MVDWHVLLAPLAVLPIVLLFGFVGCQLFFGIDEDPIPVALDIDAGCDTAASSIKITLSSFINDEKFTTTLTPVPSAGIVVSTDELKITLPDEGSVWCGVTITPPGGEPFDLFTAGQEKVEGEPLEPFTLFCIDGEFELS